MHKLCISIYKSELKFFRRRLLPIFSANKNGTSGAAPILVREVVGKGEKEKKNNGERLKFLPNAKKS